MVYIVKGPFVNVPDPDAPPADAKRIDAEYLNGVEDYLVAQDTANATFNAKVRVDTTVGKRVFVTDAAGVEHMVYADIGGWRKITAEASGVVSGELYLLRIGNTVQISAVNVKVSTSGTLALFANNGPLGAYAPDPPVSVTEFAYDATAGGSRVTLNYVGGMFIYSATTTATYIFTMTYLTGRPMPTVLLGTPA